MWTVIMVSARPFGLGIQAQQDSTVSVWLDLVNETRLDEGLDPYSQSRLLTQAAQRHADDLAENGFTDPDDVHRGSDGTDEQERIEEAGYAAWTLNDDQLAVAESVWSGRGTPQDALASFLEDQDDREHLLSDAYREIGIGASTDADGRNIVVLDVGARPNVLPIFINDGAASTENREVAIRLTNEKARPGGEGTIFIGEAIEMRISNEPSFDELAWEPWAPLVSWMLPDTSGEHTVYVQFRDAAGRTAASADSIVLDEGTPTAPTVTPITLTPTVVANDTAVPTDATSEPATPDDEAAVTSGPSATASPPGSAVSPTATAPLVARVTPFPTWTPLPSPSPTTPDPDGSGEAMLSPPKMKDYGRPLAAVGILQGVVVVLGIYWVLSRGKGA